MSTLGYKRGIMGSNWHDRSLPCDGSLERVIVACRRHGEAGTR